MAAAKIIEVKTRETADTTKEMIYDELKSNLAEWLTAKEDPFWRPPIELVEKNGEFILSASLAGTDLEDVEILVAPEILLIKGEARPDAAGRGTIHRSEFPHGKLRRSVEFPKAIDPNRVQAQIRDGMLSVRAEIAGAQKSRLSLIRAA